MKRYIERQRAISGKKTNSKNPESADIRQRQANW